MKVIGIHGGFLDVQGGLVAVIYPNGTKDPQAIDRLMLKERISGPDTGEKLVGFEIYTTRSSVRIHKEATVAVDRDELLRALN